MSERRIIVISDIHIGAGQLEDFDKELEGHLCKFIAELSSKDYGVELVINGDFLEFLQSPPWRGPELESRTKDNIPLCFTQKQSVKKLEEIYNEHKAVFSALGDFISADSKNRLTIIPGNHDADYFWPEVRASFTEYVCGLSHVSGKRLKYHLEQTYSPPDLPQVLIEHGHQYDPINSFFINEHPCWSEFSPPIFEDIGGTPRLFECVGSRFLIKYLNGLDLDYHFVDNVKPFSRFLNIFGKSIFTRGRGPFKAAFAVWGMLRYVTRLSVSHRKDILATDEEEEIDPRPLLEEFEQTLSNDQENLLRERLKDRGFDLDRSLKVYISDEDDAGKFIDFLADNLDLADIAEQGLDEEIPELDIDEKRGYLELIEGFRVNETALLVDAAIKHLRGNTTKAVVMGHTHEAVLRPEGLNYINSGCWTRYYRHGLDEELSSWAILKNDSYKYFPYRLNYVEIDPAAPKLISQGTFKERDND